MRNDEIYYVFVEPHICGGDATILVSKKKAIEYMRCNYAYLRSAPDDEVAEEFCTINRAWRASEEEEVRYKPNYKMGTRR